MIHFSSLFTETVIQNKLINLKENFRKNQSKSIKNLVNPLRIGTDYNIELSEQQDNGDVTLNLSPIVNVSSNQEEDEIDSYSDWTDVE